MPPLMVSGRGAVELVSLISRYWFPVHDCVLVVDTLIEVPARNCVELEEPPEIYKSLCEVFRYS